MNEFQRRSAEINDLLCVLNVLNWDARTQMPAGGSGARAQQMATISALAQERLLDPAFEAAAREAVARAENRAARQALEAVSALRRVPAELTRELAVLKGEAQDVWARARAASDFGLFAPLLTRMVALNRQLAEALGYEEHPYDALLNMYEPGLTRGDPAAPV